MTILRYEGIVRIDDGLFIGDKEVTRELSNSSFKGPVTIAFADERFTGDLYALTGSAGYSEYTPGDPAELEVGEHDILDYLRAYEDKQIILWVADEPINTLDPPPSWV